MTIPSTNYVVNKKGKKVFVQLSLKDWEKFVAEYERMQSLLDFKQKLKNAFREVRQIQKGKKTGTSLNDFLNEL